MNIGYVNDSSVLSVNYVIGHWAVESARKQIFEGFLFIRK